LPATVTCSSSSQPASSRSSSASSAATRARIGSVAQLGRNVRLPAGAEQCNFAVYISIDHSTLTPATLTVEVIRTDTWNYESVKTYERTDLSYYAAYRLYSPPSWTPGARDITIRVVAVGQEFGVLRLLADDVHIHCRVA
jgi:hypothetical protein